MTTIKTARGEITIRPTRESDLDAFRELRLQALREHPEAFASDHDESQSKPREFWIDRMRHDARQITFVAEDVKTGTLAGLTGIYRSESVKLKHSADIWGVFVRPHWRGLRLSDAFVGACLRWARDNHIRIVRLAVVDSNAAAIRSYQRCGFEQYGLAAEVIYINGKYHDELLMARRP